MKADAAPKVTSADVRGALLLRYPAASHALMFEVAPKTGGGTTYADAVAVGLWASHGHAIEGFEIKVARSDWLNELKQPGKSEPVMRYCHRWWLACAPGVAKVEELPPNWGMLELGANGVLRVKHQAAKLEPASVTLGFFASLVRRGGDADNAVIEKEVAKRVAEATTKIRTELQNGHHRELGHRHTRAEEVMVLLEAFKERTGVDLLNYGHGKDWFESAALLHKLGREWGVSLPGIRKSMADCIKVIDDSGLVPAEPVA